jgi:hypothetical protein
MSIATRASSGELVTIKTDQNTLEVIEGIVGECSLEALADANQFYRTMKLAAGISALRKAITNDMMAEIMPLQGSSLGFRTDKDKDGGYPLPVVKDCMIEAVLKGAYMVGNEMNIIAGRAYFTKEFYTRKLREFPGLTDLKIKLGVPVLREGKAFVSASADWNLDGRPGRLEKAITKVGDRDVDERIPVKVNQGMSDDAILGKADRKMKKAIYDLLTGSETSDGDVTDATNGSAGAIAQRPTTLDAVTERLEGKPASEQPLAPGELAADLSAFHERCLAAKTIGEVTAADEALRGPNGRTLTDDEAVLADAWKADALERIRAGRGDRSNKTEQKTLTD